jgi:cytochrome c5
MWHIPSLAAALIAAGFALPASAAPQDRSGKEVVDAVCAGCHATGKDGAPQIGDTAAWRKRASVGGLDNLAEHAITGVRKIAVVPFVCTGTGAR